MNAIIRRFLLRTALTSSGTRRCFRVSAPVLHKANDEVLDENNSVAAVWECSDGEKVPIRMKIGDTLLQAAHKNDIDLEGACEGSLACSTCHVILESEMYKKLKEPEDEENDMLDMAFGLTETSRLGCQVVVTKDMENTRIKIPQATRNFAVDGFVPKPH